MPEQNKFLSDEIVDDSLMQQLEEGFSDAGLEDETSTSPLYILPEKETRLPPDLIRTVFTTSVTGYSFGTGLAFMETGVSLEAFLSGAILRYSAIGALSAGSIGFMWTMSLWSYNAIRQFRLEKLQNNRRKEYENIDAEQDDSWISTDEPEPKIGQRKRAFWNLSDSRFFTWDMRVFMMSQTFGILAGVIFMNVAPDDDKLLGDYPARAIGSVIGAALGLIPYERIGLLITKYLRKNPMIEPERRLFLRESQHDVPFYVRLFCGAVAAYAATSVFDHSATDKNFDMVAYNQIRLWTTLFSSTASLLSPTFFAVLRSILKRVKVNIENKDVKSLLSQKPWNESQMDIPWYARLLCGAIFSSAVTVANSVVKKNPAALLFQTFALVLVYPSIFFLTRLYLALLSRIWGNRYRSENVRTPPSALPKLAYDMPSYGRLAIASLAGVMWGQIIQYASTDYDSYEKDPSSPWPAVGYSVFAVFACLSPLAMHVIGRIGFKHAILNPIRVKHEDLGLPWYGRFLAGYWMGAVLGTSFAYLFGSADSDLVIPAYIGPEFLGLSNAVGATTGASIVGVIALLWPLFETVRELLLNKVKTTDFSAVSSLFSQCKRAGDENVENDEELNSIVDVRF